MTNWQRSTRAQRLPTDWSKRRARILRNTPLCQRCETHPPTEVDHITPGDDHSYTNLQALCGSCHQTKTLTERPKRTYPTNRRPPEQHPGLT